MGDDRGVPDGDTQSVMDASDGAGLDEVRRSYQRAALDLGDLSTDDRSDPLAVVRRWLHEAVADGREPEPTAMVLATVDRVADGADARVVLCKQVDSGLVFYTNRRSAKGRQLAAAPLAAAVCHWPVLERQVRCRGRVVAVDDAASDRYFASRPRASRVGAWASSQSQPIDDRADLERQRSAVEQRFADTEVPRPPHWGGYRLVPDEIELWQGRPSRLHDRLLATRSADGWAWTRLQP